MNSNFYQGLPKKPFTWKFKTAPAVSTVNSDELEWRRRVTNVCNWWVGKAKMHQERQKSALSLSVATKCWINSSLFDEWVKELDKKFEKENRRNILIVNNCPAHPIIESLKAVEVVFLSSNRAAKTLRSLKAKYRKKKGCRHEASPSQYGNSRCDAVINVRLVWTYWLNHQRLF